MKKILILILCLVCLVGCNNKEDKNIKKDYTKEIVELLEDNYNLSLFSISELELFDTSVEVGGKEYNLVNNDKIKSINELNSLVDKVYTPEKQYLFHEQLHKDKEFLELNEKIYVYNNNGCDIGKDYDFNKFSILEQTKEHLIIEIDRFNYYIFIRDDKIYLSDNVYMCLSEKEEMLKIDQDNLDNFVD